MHRFAIIISFLFTIVCSAEQLGVSEQSTSEFKQFFNSASESSARFDFRPVDDLLNAVVLDMGMSNRAFVEKVAPKVGTRFSQFVNVKTGNEGNRVAYELLKHDDYLEKLGLIRKYLEQLPAKISLGNYPKSEQLAYWLNLYNITLIHEISKTYPIAKLEDFLHGQNGILNQELVRVDGKALSLNDIHYEILKEISGDNPLVIYGIYQGVIGGPNIRKQAYTGRNVYKLLEKSAVEFVNSNRGTMEESDGRILVSSFYKNNSIFFNKSEEELKSHILEYAQGDMKQAISESDQLVANITDWSVTDLYGTFRKFGQGSSTNSAGLLSTQLSSNGLSYKVENTARHLTREQIVRFKQLMVVRAKNYGGTSVTVTDLPSDE